MGLLLVAGCASSGPAVLRPTPGAVPSGFPNHSPTTIRHSIAAASDSIAAVSAVAEVRVRTPEVDNSYKSWLRLQNGDSLLVSVSPGFGIQAVRGLATPDSVFLHNRFHHELYFGAFAAARTLVPGVDSLTALFANLTGTLRPPTAPDWQLRADSSYYYLEARSAERREIYVVDPSLWRVVRYQLRDGSGALVEERVFSGFHEVGGFFFPRQIRVRRPSSQQELTVHYESATINPENLELRFAIDPTVKRIPLNLPQ